MYATQTHCMRIGIFAGSLDIAADAYDVRTMVTSIKINLSPGHHLDCAENVCNYSQLVLPIFNSTS